MTLVKKGYEFRSDTDSEVLVNLIAEGRKCNDSMLESISWALKQVDGAYAIAVVSVDEPGTVYAARVASPLVMGVGVGENFVASDIPAFLPYTREVVFIEDGELVKITSSSWEVFRADSLEPVEKDVKNH